MDRGIVYGKPEILRDQGNHGCACSGMPLPNAGDQLSFVIRQLYFDLSQSIEGFPKAQGRYRETQSSWSLVPSRHPTGSHSVRSPKSLAFVSCPRENRGQPLPTNNDDKHTVKYCSAGS
jgi:hypothetical protein